ELRRIAFFWLLQRQRFDLFIVDVLAERAALLDARQQVLLERLLLALLGLGLGLGLAALLSAGPDRLMERQPDDDRDDRQSGDGGPAPRIGPHAAEVQQQHAYRPDHDAAEVAPAADARHQTEERQHDGVDEQVGLPAPRQVLRQK